MAYVWSSLYLNMGSPTGILQKFTIRFKGKSSYQWLLPNYEWIYKEESLKYFLKSLDGYLISCTLPHRQELTFAVVEGQLYHVVIAIHQLYISLIHQFIQSTLSPKFKITCTVKLDNEFHLIKYIDKIFWLCQG